MPFYWNPKLARYQDQDTGRIVSHQTVLRDINASIAQAMVAPAVVENGVLSAGAATLANLSGAGLISPSDFNDLFRAEIKREYIRQYLAGIGGREMMTPSDWGSIGGMIGEQYRYLNGFIDAIASGDLSEAQITARAGMYINSAREAFEKANQKAQIAAGYDEVLWVMNIPAEHCPDCEEFAAMGWTKIADDAYGGCVPGQGCTVCLTACQCHLEYRKSGEVE